MPFKQQQQKNPNIKTAIVDLDKYCHWTNTR